MSFLLIVVFLTRLIYGVFLSCENFSELIKLAWSYVCRFRMTFHV